MCPGSRGKRKGGIFAVESPLPFMPYSTLRAPSSPFLSSLAPLFVKAHSRIQPEQGNEFNSTPSPFFFLINHAVSSRLGRGRTPTAVEERTRCCCLVGPVGLAHRCEWRTSWLFSAVSDNQLANARLAHDPDGRCGRLGWLGVRLVHFPRSTLRAAAATRLIAAPSGQGQVRGLR